MILRMKKFYALFLCLVLLLIPPVLAVTFADPPTGYTLDAGTKTYTVTTADGLLDVIALINAGRFDYNITLGADIDLTGREYTPIAPSWNSTSAPNDFYTGTIEGNGHTITGMTISDGKSNRGLIAFSGDNVTVRNLFLESPSILCESYSGFVIGSSRGTNVTVSNVHVENGTVTGTANYLGGLIGRYDNASRNVTTLIENCTVRADLSGTQSIGGMVGGEGVGGSLTFTATFRNIAVNGTFSASNKQARIGGVIGYSNLVNITFENCVTVNEAIGTDDIGGLTGVTYKANFAIRNCFSNRSFSGGLSTNQSQTVHITNSAVLSLTAKAVNYFSNAPDAAAAAYVTATVDGDPVPCLNLQVPAVTAEILTRNMNEMYAAADENFRSLSMAVVEPELPNFAAFVLCGLQMGQTNAVGNTFSCRFVGTIPVSCTLFDSIGFDVAYTDPSTTESPSREFGLQKVYTTLLANENGTVVTYSASDLGGEYIAALEFKDLPATGTCVFTVSPFTVVDSTKLNGVAYDIIFVNGELTSFLYSGIPASSSSEFDVRYIESYTIVYADEPTGLESVANSLCNAIKKATGKTLPVVCDSDSPERIHEILIGPTNRSFSRQCYAESSHIMQYEIQMQKGKLQLVVGGPYSAMKCVDQFTAHVLTSGEKLREGVSYYATELATDSQPLTEGADIRVMSSNVLAYQWGEEDYPNVYPVATRAEIYAGVLLRFLPDIVGAQETDNPWMVALPYYLTAMAEKDGVEYTHLLCKVENRGRMVVNFSSILFRSDLYTADASGCDVFEANYQSSYCQRVGSWAKFTSKSDPTLQMVLVNSHWAHETEARILSCVNEEAALVARMKEQYPGVPIFCTADYNSDATKKPRDEADNPNVKTRDQYFLQFVDLISGTVASDAAREKGVLITPGGCRGSASSMGETKLRGVDNNFIDHIVMAGGYADVLRHDTIRSNGCHVMTDHSPIYADLSLRQSN